MPTPTVINLSDTNPAQDSGFRNGNYRSSAPYNLTVTINGQQVTVQARDVSVEQPNFGGVSARTTTSEAITAADRGKLVTFLNASAVACSLPNATSFASGLNFLCAVKNLGAGTVTITPTAGTIDGAASLAVPTGASFFIFTDGTNYISLKTDLSSYALISKVQQAAYIYAADTGTANAYAVTLSPAPTLVDGSLVLFKAAHANTTASTLAVNGGTARAITKSGTTALAGGEIAAGQMILVVYDSSGPRFQLVGAGGGSGSASWGSITGTLSSQTDLQSALDAKASIDGVQKQSYIYAADTGTANAYAISVSPTPSIVAGSRVVFKAAHGNSGASTLNVNSGGAVAIKKNGASDLAAGDISTGQIVSVIYDGTYWQITAGAVGPAGGGGLVLLGTHTASSSASLILTEFSSLFDNYLLVFENLLPATTSVDMNMDLSSDGGVTWDNTATHYGAGQCFIDGVTFSGAASLPNNKFRLAGINTNRVSNSLTNGGMNGTLKVFNPLSASSYKYFASEDMMYWDTSANRPVKITWFGYYPFTTAVNALRIIPSSGNIASGTIRVYALTQ